MHCNLEDLVLCELGISNVAISILKTYFVKSQFILVYTRVSIIGEF